ncbi:hypothetical protein IPC30_30585 [Pseudomonas aeruginosa]|nr:hypothetical protein IPC30_30585 [Pseudomonas aeruginosa]
MHRRREQVVDFAVYRSKAAHTVRFQERCAILPARGKVRQAARRFYSVQIDDWRESESFRSFLAGVEQNLPLRRPSNLDGAEVIGFLLENTGGRMDSIMNSIKSAACYAVKSGEERITIGSLVKAISTPWSY